MKKKFSRTNKNMLYVNRENAKKEVVSNFNKKNEQKLREKKQAAKALANNNNRRTR